MLFDGEIIIIIIIIIMMDVRATVVIERSWIHVGAIRVTAVGESIDEMAHTADLIVYDDDDDFSDYLF